jgi:hypothetical protein
MGLVFGIIAVAVIVGGALLATMFAGKGGSQPDMAPNSIDDMSITQAAEGSVVPIVYGRVRITGNIIWYDNLLVIALKEQVHDGKGDSDGDDEIITGYRYYLDVWQAVCRGQISWITTYVNDEEKPVSGSIYKNDGTEATYPHSGLISWGGDSPPGANANKLPGVAHVFYRRWWIGDNTTMVPTVHYVVERSLSFTGITNEDLATGTNPHAIIYDILTEAGATDSEIDETSFNAAGSYWNDQGYGLNLAFKRQSKARDKINHILKMVGGVFGVNHLNKFILSALDPSATSSVTIDTEDWIEFSFSRRTWFDTFNEFRGNFVDSAQDYSQRTVIVRNAANRSLQGRVRTMTVDLSGFRTIEKASKRLHEIMKRESYPYAKIKAVTSLKFWELNVGDIVEVVNTDYNISSAEFRVLKKDVREVDQNKIGWELEQFNEILFDAEGDDGGDPGWVPLVKDPDPLVYQALYELPYNPTTGSDRAYLQLCARVNNWEYGWETHYSSAGVDYESVNTFSGWSQYGTLDQAYPADTYSIDDETGIHYTPYRDDPQFVSVSRQDLFVVNRFALIDDEIIKFQTVTPEGSNSYHLTGIIRGVFNTTPALHSSGSPIWLFTFANNMLLRGITAADFYTKFLPQSVAGTVDIGDATAIHTTTIHNRASAPWDVTSIKAVRSGSAVTLTIYTTTQIYDGAGKFAGDVQVDYTPTGVDDQLEVYDSDEGASASQFLVSGTDSRSKAGAFTYYARQKNGTFTSAWVSVYVDTADGTYWS